MSYLYKDAVLTERIQSLRGAPGAAREGKPPAKSSDASLRTKLHAAVSRIEALERENKQLQKENRSLLSKLMGSA